MPYRMEALVASLKHDCKRASEAALGTLTLPSAGTGTHGRFVCVSVEGMGAILEAVEAAQPPLLIPEFDPQTGQISYPGGIKPGQYSASGLTALLRVHRENPEAIRFIADMLEP